MQIEDKKMSNKIKQDLCDALGQFSLLWQRELRPIIESEEVTPTEKRVLYGLFRLERANKQTLADAVALQHSSISRALDRLEERGYISRTISCNNKRFIDLCLTKSGQSKVEAIREKALVRFMDVSEIIQPDEIKKTITVVEVLVAKILEKK